MNKATSVEDMATKLKEILGLPFINTIAADRHGDAIRVFRACSGVGPDTPLGDIQYVVDEGSAGTPRIPMHGGPGREGIFNVAETPDPNADCKYTPVTKGSTYMQAVTFDRNGPVADALLGYSQSADPTRPFHRDQTGRYSAKDWIRLPFRPEEIRDQAIGRKIHIFERPEGP